jgi:GTPase SAR1 family protein
MRSIAFMGPSRGGKSSIAKEIARQLDPNVYGNIGMLSFADTLREIASTRFGWTGEKTPKQRDIIQKASESWKRQHGEDIFAIDLLVRAKCKPACYDTIIIDDLRHGCELGALRNNTQATILCIDEEQAEHVWAQAFSAHKTVDDEFSWAVHRSELEWRGFRHLYQHINNDKTSPYGFDISVNKIMQILHQGDN